MWSRQPRYELCRESRLYEEFFITDYRTDIDRLCRYLGEYESIDELNYLANMLDELDDRDLAKFEAALDYGEYVSDVEQLINLAQNLDCCYVVTPVNRQNPQYCLSLLPNIQKQLAAYEDVFEGAKELYRSPALATLLYVDWIPPGQWSAVSQNNLRA